MGEGEAAAVYVVTYDVITMEWSVSPKKDIPTPIVAEKAYDLKNYKTGKMIINDPSVSITLDDASDIKNGLVFRGTYAEFHGEGFAKTPVTINPKKAEAIIDFKGTNMQKVIIDGTKVKEIRGAENIQAIEYIKGATAEQIKFFNSKGEPIVVPSFSDENKAPVVKKAIPNQTVEVGESLSIQLTDHFSDPENDKLTFTATKGTLDGASLNLALEEGSHLVGVTASDGEKSITINFSVTVNAVYRIANRYLLQRCDGQRRTSIKECVA